MQPNPQQSELVLILQSHKTPSCLRSRHPIAMSQQLDIPIQHKLLQIT